jgi:hypothetical protein
MVVKAIFGLLLAVASALGLHLIEITDQDRYFDRSRGDMRALARLVSQRHGSSTVTCSASNDYASGSSKTLMRSITLVETHLSSTAERLSEFAAVYLMSWLGLTVPDWSVGPAQIKPSTAIKAQDAADQVLETGGQKLTHMALRLLEPCQNYQAGLLVLSSISKRNNITSHELTKSDILTITHAYNTGNGAVELEGRVAVHLYQNLVYHTYQELRSLTLPNRSE